MILDFKDYQDSYSNLDFNAMGEINESHEYSESVCSVMDKLTFYVKRAASLENSTLNESAKRAYSRDILFNRNEKIAASCIFTEMLKKYEESMKEEISLCESVIYKFDSLDENAEYEYDELSEILALDEGWKDLVDKGKKKFISLKDNTVNILNKAEDLYTKGVEKVKAKKDDLVAWAKAAKKDFEERFESLKKIIDDIVKKGIDSVSAFINKILDAFSSIGDNLVDVVKRLGGLKLEKGEKPAELNIEDGEGIYKNAKSDDEKSFINNIIIRVNAMLSDDKDNAAKLMTESYLEESIVDNKYIAWLAGYKNDGTKMSWWKCILIGLCASLIVWAIPKVLVLTGVGSALALFIGAFVGVLWNGVGLLKLIYRRNKERKPGEKFFNKSTSIFFFLSCLSMIFSVTTFVKTIGPLMREMCNHFGWTGGDDMSAFGKFIYEHTLKHSPKDAFEGGVKEWSEQVKNYGGDVRGNDLIDSKDKALDLLDKMPGASDANKDAAKDFFDAALASKGSTGVYKALDAFKDNGDLPLTGVFDTSKWGGSGPIRQAIDALKDSGEIPDSTILGTIGSTATQAASHGQYGFASYIMGADKDQLNTILQKAAEIAGKDAGELQLHIYGNGVIPDIISHTETIDGAFKLLTNDVPFLPMVMPFFDEKKWGKYKMRFSSATKGYPAYVVDKVDMMPYDKIEIGDDDAKALKTLKSLHDDAWADFKKNNPDEINESKKDKKEKKEKVEEPQFIVFYVNPDDETGKENDKAENEHNTQKKSAVGVVLDTLTMCIADVCNFNDSVKKRRRSQPYFMKGLLSSLSFRPLENNDNDTKDYIRTTLGQTMKTVILQNVLYGAGKKYIDAKVDGKKAEYKLRDKILGTDTKVNPDKKEFELGNFTPNELIECLSDKSSNNKASYDFLDGKYAAKVSIKTDNSGKVISTKATRDAASIENQKFYRVKKEDYKATMDAWDKEVKKWEKGGKEGKRPKKPSFIIGEDKEYYKRASKKFMAMPENKRKHTYDYIDIKIIPLLKKGDLYKKLIENEKIKKMLYKEDEDKNIKLNKDVVKVLKPFLYRPEKTFAKDDEYELSKILKEQGIEAEKLGWVKNLFKDEEQLHDTFKELVEIIWDFLSDNIRDSKKQFDNKPNKKDKKNESFDTLYDELIEEFFDEDYDDESEFKYDMFILEEENKVVPSFSKFISERY